LTSSGLGYLIIEIIHAKKVMAKKKIPDALLKGMEASTIELLNDIAQMHICCHGPDALSAVRNGAILLSIAAVDNDEDGDGFRYLIGLRNGVAVTPFLGNFFERI
jgi:hypothetical protein